MARTRPSWVIERIAAIGQRRTYRLADTARIGLAAVRLHTAGCEPVDFHRTVLLEDDACEFTVLFPHDASRRRVPPVVRIEWDGPRPRDTFTWTLELR